MINASELRIGSYVDCFGVKQVNGIYPSIDNYRIEVCAPFHKETLKKTCEIIYEKAPEIKAIAVTPKNLELFGFINNQFSAFWILGDFEIEKQGECFY